MKGEKCSGGKLSKVQLTGIAAANAYDEKLPIFAVGKSKKPRCFSCFSVPSTRKELDEWRALWRVAVTELDNKFYHEGYKVVMVFDNCPAHPHIKNLKAMAIVFMPRSYSKLESKIPHHPPSVASQQFYITTKPFPNWTFSKPYTCLQKPVTKY